jgi:hypothetical protein
VRAKLTALATCGLIAASTAAVPAYAERGVTVDPQSPAGVEYAVPLDSGRGHGGNHGGSGGGSSQSDAGSPQLFGSGIKPVSSSTDPAAKPKAARGGGDGGSNSAGGRSKPRPGSRSSSAVAPVAASAAYSTTGPVAGLIGAIVLVGGGFGLFARMRARRAANDRTLS